MNILKIILFFVAICGYFLVDRYKFEVDSEVCLLHISTFAACIVYIFSLFGALRIGCWIIELIGLVYFVLSLSTLKNIRYISKTTIISFVLILCSILYVIWKISDGQLVLFAGSNFSHYAIYVKYLLIYHKLPTSATSLFDFYGYPPISSLFIYFNSELLGVRSEISMVVFQAAWGILAISTLLASKKNYVQSVIFFGLTEIYYLYAASGNRIEDLLVDSLLGAMIVAAIQVISLYGKDKRKCNIVLIPILGVIALLKVSGLFFVGFICLYYFLLDRERKKTSLAVIVPAIMWVLWQIYLKIAYCSISSGENAISVGYWKEKIAAKTFTDIKSITINYIATQVLFDKGKSLFFLAFILFGIVLYLRWKRRDVENRFFYYG